MRVDAARLRTARTNDGEWWLIGPDVDMTTPERKDFQVQLDGTFAPTPLPVGPDYLHQHPEWRFAIIETGESQDRSSGPARRRSR